MTLKITGAIFGAKELQKALDELPKSLSKAALREALKKVSKPIVDVARLKAPKSTGGGAESIDVRNNPSLKPVGVSIGPDRDHFYMSFQEFGTSRHTGQPFLRPAWDENSHKILPEFGKILWAIILKKSKTLAKKAEKGTLGKRTARELRGG